MSGTRNTLDPEAVVWNRGDPPGRWTFNAPPPDDYEGRIVCFETLRLGDHAHIEVSTGRQHNNGAPRTPTYHKGEAGKLIFAWEDWLHFRAALDAIPWCWIAEVEHPTPGQLDRYVPAGAVRDRREACG